MFFVTFSNFSDSLAMEICLLKKSFSVSFSGFVDYTVVILIDFWWWFCMLVEDACGLALSLNAAYIFAGKFRCELPQYRSTSRFRKVGRPKTLAALGEQLMGSPSKRYSLAPRAL